jgi:hypothetical protein
VQTRNADVRFLRNIILADEARVAVFLAHRLERRGNRVGEVLGAVIAQFLLVPHIGDRIHLGGIAGSQENRPSMGGEGFTLLKIATANLDSQSMIASSMLRG